MKPRKILFVCLGNICRSPTAEAVFRKKAADNNIPLFLDSAGTANYHVGERSDPRSIRHAEARGYQMTHLGRQIHQKDFEDFDLLLVMDQSNFKNVIEICPVQFKSKVKLLTTFCSDTIHSIVPDPYYGGPEDFELVLDIIENAWLGFEKSVN